MRQTRQAIEFLMPHIGSAISGILGAYKKNSDDLNNNAAAATASTIGKATQDANASKFTPEADKLSGQQDASVQALESGAKQPIPTGRRLGDIMGQAGGSPSDVGGSDPAKGLTQATQASAQLSGLGDSGSSGSTVNGGNINLMTGDYGSAGADSGASAASPVGGGADAGGSSGGSGAAGYAQLAQGLGSILGATSQQAPAAQLPQAGSSAYTPTANAEQQSLQDVMKKYQGYRGAM